ncbi:hypothetical protein ACTJKW_13370 [Serratia marcescens]|uniref:hypothetical protein n=1 Tax=Serratia marcescens TaxID=615 RepID=UPI003F850060
MKTKKSISMLAITLLLVSCSSGKLTINHTKETVTAGHEAIGESKKYFDVLLALQQKRAVVVYATQPNCKFNTDGKITVRINESSVPNPNSPLCATPQDFKNNNVMLLNLMPLDLEMFQPDLDILSAFSSYLSALTVYTADPTYPVGDLVDKALTKAESVKSLANLTDNQKKSVSNLAGFLQRLAEEEKNGRDIAKLIKQEGKNQTDNMELVKQDIHQLKTQYDDVMKQDIFNFTVDNFNKRTPKSPQPSDMEKSAVYIDNIITLNNLTQKSIKNPTAAEQAIEAFQRYHEGLISIIDDNIIDKKIKEEKLKIQQENLKEALGYIKDFVKDFTPLLVAAL